MIYYRPVPYRSFLMWRRKRAPTVEELRLASPECYRFEDEEKEEGEMVQKASVKDVCCKCNLTFGLAEKRVAIDSKRVMHEDCYAKHLGELSERSRRIDSFRREAR